MVTTWVRLLVGWPVDRGLGSGGSSAVVVVIPNVDPNQKSSTGSMLVSGFHKSPVLPQIRNQSDHYHRKPPPGPPQSTALQHLGAKGVQVAMQLCSEGALTWPGSTKIESY